MQKRPNILLITTDQQRFDAMGLNGNAVLRTPNMDRLAGVGVNFTRAYTTCPSCIAARRSMLTGLHPSDPRHGLPGYQDGLEWSPPFTLPGLLKKGGYQTQLVGKFHMFPQRKRYGFDNLALSEQLDYRPDSIWFGQNDYADWLRAKGEPFSPIASGIGGNSHVARPFHLHENLHHTSWCVEEAIDFLRRRRDPSCPWFLHLSFWAPHPPFVPPQAYWDRYVGMDYRPNVAPWAASAVAGRPISRKPDASVGPFADWADSDAAAGYYGLINHVDDRLAHLFFRGLEAGGRNRKEPLWIIYTTDHGEMLGDHLIRHKQVPYEGSTHIPFFISGMNVDCAQGRSEELACLEDLLPTICDLAGVEAPGDIYGRSLAPLVRGQSPRARQAVHGEHSGPLGNHWIVSGRLKYCWFTKTNEEQLFDLSADPLEHHDLSGQGELLAPMRAEMARHLAGRSDFNYDPAKLDPLAGRTPRAIYNTVPAL